MTATLIVRHPVHDYAAWRQVYDSVSSLQLRHGVTDSEVLQLAGDVNEVVVIHRFASVAEAESLVGDPELKSAMERGGVSGPPRIEILIDA